VSASRGAGARGVAAPGGRASQVAAGGRLVAPRGAGAPL